MTEINRYSSSPLAPQRDSLVDVLDRVLDKGVVIAGDVAINLLGIELLTIKLRLLIASVDKAKEIGLDWWERDPQLSGKARESMGGNGRDPRALERENQELRQRLQRLESKMSTLLEHESPQPSRRGRNPGA